MLIFDFDGVLMNSIDEVALTAYNTIAESLLISLADMPAGPLALFKRNRFHVQQIGDAVTLMEWCLVNHQLDLKRILTAEEYRAIAGGATLALISRTNLIYETRRRFIDKDTTHWLALHRPYQPLWKELMRRKSHGFVILTNKNLEATSRLCRHFGLNINDHDIYSGDNGVTKIENMCQIQDRFADARFAFIDDSIKNLKELDRRFNQDTKVLSLLLANWGYIGPQDAWTARESGYPFLNQTEVIQLLDRYGEIYNYENRGDQLCCR